MEQLTFFQIDGVFMPIIPKQRRGGRGGENTRFTLDSVRTAALAHRVNTLLDDLKVRESEIEKYETENEKYKQICESQKEVTTKLFGFISGLYSLLPESKKSPEIVEGLRNANVSSFNEASETILSHFSQESQIDPSKLKDFMTSNQMLLMNNQLHREMDEMTESNKSMEEDLKTNKLTITRLTREIATHEEEIRNLKEELEKMKNASSSSDNNISQTTNDDNNNTNNVNTRNENNINSKTSNENITETQNDDHHDTDSKHNLSSMKKEEEGDEIMADNNINPDQSSSVSSSSSSSSSSSKTTTIPSKEKVDSEVSANGNAAKIEVLELQVNNYRDMFMETFGREQNLNQKLAKLEKEMEETKKLYSFIKQEFEKFKSLIEEKIEYSLGFEKERKDMLDKLHSSELQVMNMEKNYRAKMDELNEELEKEKNKALDSSQKMLELENKASLVLTEKQILIEDLEKKTKELENLKNKYDELIKKVEKSSSGEGEGEDMEFVCAQLEEMESLLKEKEDESGQKSAENNALKIKIKQAEGNIAILEEKLRSSSEKEARNQKDIEMLKSNMSRLIEEDENAVNSKISSDEKILELQELLNRGNIEYIKSYTKDIEDGLFKYENEDGEIDYDMIDVNSEIGITKQKMLVYIKSLRKELESCKNDINSQRDMIKERSETIDKTDRELLEKTRQYNDLVTKSGVQSLLISEKTNESLRRELTCKICNENTFDVVLKPCGHVLCHECAEKNIESRSRKCPLCMAKISRNDILEIKK